MRAGLRHGDPAGRESGVGETGRLVRDDGVALAWARTQGRGPTTVFLPGFRSDMGGAKALEVAAFCAEHGLACLRLDYSGHGASDGRFEDGTIGRWTEDALLADRPADRGSAGLGRLQHGRLDRAAAGAGPAGARRRAGRDRGGAGLHRALDVGVDDAAGARGAAPRRRPGDAERLWRAHAGDAHPDRGRAVAPAARGPDRDRVPRAAAARAAGP